MEDRRFEDIIRSKLKENEADVPAHLWAGIAEELPRQPKRVWLKPAYRYVAACAALLFVSGIGTYLLFKTPAGEKPILLTENAPGSVNRTVSGMSLQDLEVSSANNQISHDIPLQGPDIFGSVNQAEHDISLQGSDASGSANRTNLDMPLQDSPDYLVDVSRQTTLQSLVDEGEVAETTHPASVSDEEYARQLKAFESAGQPQTAMDYPTRKTPKRNGFTVGMMASNALPDRQKTENRPLTRSAMFLDNDLQLYQADEPLKFLHKTPLSFGLTVEKQLPHNWGLESGLVYTLLRSDYQTPSRSRQGKQEFHYLGIPLNAIYRFAAARRFSFYAGIGGEADFNISGRRIEDIHHDNKEAKHTEDIRDRRVQWSIHVKAGAAFTLFKTTELYAEPGVSYYIDSHNLPNLWKDRPVNFVVQLGLRTHF